MHRNNVRQKDELHESFGKNECQTVDEMDYWLVPTQLNTKIIDGMEGSVSMLTWIYVDSAIT